MSLLNKIHHIGYLVNDINKSLKIFLDLGYKIYSEPKFDTIRKVNICFLYLENNFIELIEPNEESSIYPLLKKYKNSPYHICYQVENIDTAVQKFTHKGFILIDSKEKAPAISDNSYVAFLMHTRIGIIELLELS